MYECVPQQYPQSDDMNFTLTSTVNDELNTIWTPKILNADGVSQDFPPWLAMRDPHVWTKTQVWQWLQQVAVKHQMDAASFPFPNFDMDGHQLCNMSYQDFILAAGSIGHILFHSIAELKWSGATESSKGAHLWEFIRDILLNSECNPGLIRWEDRTAGVFRLLKSEAVAQLWGKKKNNCRMNYEKLSRAMRYYYAKGILDRVDGQRLVYKFGINADGWKESET
ncbi:ETS homologous factor [Neosynchiropus ocellatus]